jgi:hypothetical protein
MLGGQLPFGVLCDGANFPAFFLSLAVFAGFGGVPVTGLSPLLGAPSVTFAEPFLSSIAGVGVGFVGLGLSTPFEAPFATSAGSSLLLIADGLHRHALAGPS